MRGAGGVTAADRGVSAGAVPYVGDPPSDALTVAGQLDWQQRHVGARAVVSSHADLERLFPASGGVHTVTSVVEVAASITLPAGVRIVQTGGGLLTSPLAVRCSISGNVAGALISGENLALQGVTLINASTDPAASHFASTGPGRSILNRVICAGPARVGTLTPGSAGDARIVGCAWSGCSTGLLLDGAMLGVRIDTCVAQSMGAGAYAFALGSTAAPSVGVGLLGCSIFIVGANQHLLRVDPSAPLASGQVVVRVQECAASVLSGSGALLDPSGLTETHPAIFATGNLGGSRSLLLGHATFADAITPINKTYSASNTFETLPFSNGAGGNVTLVATSQRFAVVQDGASWYLEYVGDNGPITVELHWLLTVQRSGGGSSNLSMRAEKYTLATATWAAIPGTATVERQQRDDPETVSGFGTAAMVPGDRLRITISNSDTSTTIVSTISLRATALV